MIRGCGKYYFNPLLTNYSEVHLCFSTMTRKTSSDKDGTKASKSEGKDYVKLKTLLEGYRNNYYIILCICIYNSEQIL